MKPAIRIAFAYFWPGFAPAQFKTLFPYVYEKYDVVLSPEPEVVFYSVFSPNYIPYADPRVVHGPARFRPGNYVRVFFTGENFEPAMNDCEFAITFSALETAANHLRLPLWVYENRGWGFGPERLVKTNRDWERVAQEKTAFCNFVYSHDVLFRNAIFSAFNRYKRVDAPSRCMNNTNGVGMPMASNRLAGKVEYFKRYKFTLAIENIIWPGYSSEKLVDPMYADSIPIYIGDPLARKDFNTKSYIDFTDFASVRELVEFVTEVDNTPGLYLKMLAEPHYRDNIIPDFAREDKILAFFDKVFAAAFERRTASQRKWM